ncbi:unnamed protein product [Cuscuta epithymum]|uniref:Uncharacterized protein n=1 Tax=Cuscuta epithymum TaxID=186058 RepID=A0AAV0G7R1_9ASTE|nr:unnamed protein product [Cuscuta epithymum]
MLEKVNRSQNFLTPNTTHFLRTDKNTPKNVAPCKCFASTNRTPSIPIFGFDAAVQIQKSGGCKSGWQKVRNLFCNLSLIRCSIFTTVHLILQKSDNTNLPSQRPFWRAEQLFLNRIFSLIGRGFGATCPLSSGKLSRSFAWNYLADMFGVDFLSWSTDLDYRALFPFLFWQLIP